MNKVETILAKKNIWKRTESYKDTKEVREGHPGDQLEGHGRQRDGMGARPSLSLWKVKPEK